MVVKRVRTSGIFRSSPSSARAVSVGRPSDDPGGGSAPPPAPAPNPPHPPPPHDPAGRLGKEKDPADEDEQRASDHGQPVAQAPGEGGFVPLLHRPVEGGFL